MQPSADHYTEDRPLCPFLCVEQPFHRSSSLGHWSKNETPPALDRRFGLCVSWTRPDVYLLAVEAPPIKFTRGLRCCSPLSGRLRPRSSRPCQPSSPCLWGRGTFGRKTRGVFSCRPEKQQPPRPHNRVAYYGMPFPFVNPRAGVKTRPLRCAPDDLAGLVEQNEGRFRSHLEQLLSH